MREIRVRVVIDEHFDRTCKGWAEEIREDTVQKLAAGDYEVFGTIVERLHCEAYDCPHHQEIGALWGTVTAVWMPGTYTLAEVGQRAGSGHPDDKHLVEVVQDILDSEA